MIQELFHVTIQVKNLREEISRVGYDEVLNRLQNTAEEAIRNAIMSGDDIYQLTDGISLPDQE